MASPYSHVAPRLQQVREQLAEAARQAGRPPEAVTLVAISKNHPAEAVEAAYQAGQRIFGENRVQEALDKMGQTPADVEWHLVGPLQSNKAKFVPGRFSAVHSVYSEKLVHALQRQAETHLAASAPPLQVLVQLNWTQEATKSGVSTQAELEGVLAALHQAPRLQGTGLMTLPDPTLDEKATRSHFATVRELLEATRPLVPHPQHYQQLSMGMSNDFEWAIAEGATLVRVGTAIFGARAY